MYACRGVFSDSFHVGVWGWDGAGGPSLQSGTTTEFGTPPLPQDTAPPNAAKDASAKEGLRSIHDGFAAFERDQGRPYDESRDGSWELALRPYVDPWPANPWTGQPMHAGNHRGDVTFDTWSDGIHLTVNISP